MTRAVICTATVSYDNSEASQADLAGQLILWLGQHQGWAVQCSITTLAQGAWSNGSWLAGSNLVNLYIVIQDGSTDEQVASAVSTAILNLQMLVPTEQNLPDLNWVPTTTTPFVITAGPQVADVALQPGAQAPTAGPFPIL
jgi:hypothetical protein